MMRNLTTVFLMALTITSSPCVTGRQTAGEPEWLDTSSDERLAREEIDPSIRRGNRHRRPSPDQARFHQPPRAKNKAEQKILHVLDDMDQNQRRGMMNVPVEDGRLLRLLTETLGAKHVVEIGTSNGYSGIWICLALRTTGGKLTTYEINTHRANLARQNFKRAGVDSLVTLIHGDAHEEITNLNEPIDLVFIDADKQGYVDYLNKLLPLVRTGGLILAHNTNMKVPEIRNYIQAVTEKPELETLFLNMHKAGVSVTLKKR